MVLYFLVVFSGITYYSSVMVLLYTIWGLFNIGLGITVFALSYRNFRFFSERYGSLAAGILFLLTVAMCQSPATKPPTGPDPNASMATVTIPDFSPNWSQSYRARLVDLGSCQLSQHIVFTKKNPSDSIQITSAVHLTGFTSGLLWKPIAVFANAGQDRRIHYSAAGTLEWRLLGMPVYYQLKQFSGSVSVDSLQTS